MKKIVLITALLLCGAIVGVFIGRRYTFMHKPVSLASDNLSQEVGEGRDLKFRLSNGKTITVIHGKSLDNRYIALTRTDRYITDAFGMYLNKVSLTQEERSAILNAYSLIYLARVRLEVALAKVTVESKNENLVAIPEYTEEGAVLKKFLYKEMENVVGSERTQEIDATVGNFIDAQNNFWGRYEQVLDVGLNEGKTEYVVTHVINPLRSNGEASRESVSKLEVGNLSLYSEFASLFPEAL